MNLPRVYPILDTRLIRDRALDVVDAAEAFLEAGAKILQLRHKDFFGRDLFRQAQQMASLCRENDALFVINDRADVALLLDAALHVGQDDLLADSARQIVGANRVLGVSTHNEEQFRDASTTSADYLALGPIFGTSNKLNPDPTVGVNELARLRMLSTKPLVAIGGITREHARSVWLAGADSIAVVGDLYPQDCDKPALRARMEEWLMVARG
jgi:thiamine-phosphate pyrophosphorylase